MPQFVQARQDLIIPYVAGVEEVRDLSRGTLVRELILRLKGQLTVTAGNNTAAGVQGGGPWGVVKRLTIELNGAQRIVSLSGRDLVMLNWQWYGHAPHFDLAGSQLGDAATANPTFDCILILPFWMPRSARPFDTVLDARRLGSFTVKVEWGTHANVHSGATAFTVAPQLSIRSLRSAGPEIAPNARFTEWRRHVIERDVAATQSDLKVSLPVGMAYRGFTFHTTDAGVDVQLLNRVSLVSGPTVFLDMDEQTLGYWSRARNGMNILSVPAVMSRGQNSFTGWRHYDHVTDGRLSEAIDTAGFSELELVFDVTKGAGVTKLYVIPDQLIIPRVPANVAAA